MELSVDGDVVNENLTNAWCMDVFHPRFGKDYLGPMFLKRITEYFSGYYLYRNTPEVSGVVSKGSHWLDIPVRISSERGVGGNRTLPEKAMHTMDDRKN